jgi:hypothetical protein
MVGGKDNWELVVDIPFAVPASRVGEQLLPYIIMRETG